MKNMYYSEQERLAYISNQPALASALADASDFCNEIDGFDDVLKKEKRAAYAEGETAGMGTDADKMIEALRVDRDRYKTWHRSAREDLEATLVWLRGDDCKTVANRRKFETRLRTRLLATPRS